jgi:hypothetical protein
MGQRFPLETMYLVGQTNPGFTGTPKSIPGMCIPEQCVLTDVIFQSDTLIGTVAGEDLTFDVEVNDVDLGINIAVPDALAANTGIVVPVPALTPAQPYYQDGISAGIALDVGDELVLHSNGEQVAGASNGFFTFVCRRTRMRYGSDALYLTSEFADYGAISASAVMVAPVDCRPVAMAFYTNAAPTVAGAQLLAHVNGTATTSIVLIPLTLGPEEGVEFPLTAGPQIHLRAGDALSFNSNGGPTNGPVGVFTVTFVRE